MVWCFYVLQDCARWHEPGTGSHEYRDFCLKDPKRQLSHYFFIGRWGDRASSRLDHCLENPSVEAALAADLITPFLEIW